MYELDLITVRSSFRQIFPNPEAFCVWKNKELCLFCVVSSFVPRRTQVVRIFFAKNLKFQKKKEIKNDTSIG